MLIRLNVLYTMVNLHKIKENSSKYGFVCKREIS